MIIILTVSILIGFIFAPLGCMVLWKRYAYFGDGFAHASMFAVTLSSIIQIPILYVGMLNAVLFIIIVFKLKKHKDNNASIGLISSITISLSLILSYIFPESVNFNHLLFGDIISTNKNDVLILSATLIIVAIFFLINHRNLIFIVLSKEIAHSRGIKVNLLEILFLSVLSFSILIAIKIAGALLITSIILIPAMIARLISTSPISMIFTAIITSQLMNGLGIILSYYFDIGFAPIIVICGGAIFLIINIFSSFSRKNYI